MFTKLTEFSPCNEYIFFLLDEQKKKKEKKGETHSNNKEIETLKYIFGFVD